MQTDWEYDAAGRDTKDVRTRADAGTMPSGALPAAPMQTGASVTPQDVIKRTDR